jgi:phage anti-repressor protein
MAYRTTEHKKAIVKMVREKRIILQIDLASMMNKPNINDSVKSLVEEGKLKRQKVNNRGKVGNLTQVWAVYRNDVKQNEILDFEKLMINKPFVSPLVENHCYKSPDKPIEQKLKKDIKATETSLSVIINEVIPIYNNNGQRTVNARELHEFLEVGTKFATWINRQIKKYDFTEGEDYIGTTQKRETSTGSTIVKDYYLNIDTAKEIAMVENNERGKYIRKYFIQVEKEYRQQNQMKPTSEITALKMIVQELENQNNRITNIENKLMSLAD